MRDEVHIVIPARLASSRLPRKALIDLGGEPVLLAREGPRAPGSHERLGRPQPGEQRRHRGGPDVLQCSARGMKSARTRWTASSRAVRGA